MAAFETIKVPSIDQITMAFATRKEEKRYVFFQVRNIRDITKKVIELRVIVEAISRDKTRLNLVIKGTAIIYGRIRKVLCSFNTLSRTGSIVTT